MGKKKKTGRAEGGPGGAHSSPLHLITHTLLSLPRLSAVTDNKPYASCSRSFRETLRPPPPFHVSDRPPGHSLGSNPLVPVVTAERLACVLCTLHVRVLLLSGRWGTAGSLRRRRPRILARAICSSSCSSTQSCAHCVRGPSDAVKR